jgi:histidine kinase
MPWYKRLRWRLLAPQFLVVCVGVGIMFLATWLILNAAPALIRPYLSQLAANPASMPQVEAGILVMFRNGISLSVLIAAVLALIAGVASAVVLWRIIITPLQQVAYSTQRIADGRYSERVDVPTESGLAMAKLVISFNQMAAALEQTEQERVALLSNVSHELRTPLTGLRGYVEGMMDGLFAADEETFAWMSQEIERLQRLVNDIQNLSRIEAGQFSLNFQDFELTAVVQRTINQLRPQAQSKDVMLTADPLPTPVNVHADVDRSTQVLINLIGNAIRYTPEGGQIVVFVNTEGHHAHIAVQDNGIGIPAEALPYLFERFYRVDNSRARKSGGSGIGLTIARHLVWAMGGEITVGSQGEKKGSTFSFTLPLA